MRLAFRGAVLAGLVFAHVVLASRAGADERAFRDHAVASGLRLPASSDALGVSVETQHIVVACRDEGGSPVCDFTATYRVTNRGSGTEEVTAPIHGRHVRNLQLEPATKTGRESIEEQIHQRLCDNRLTANFTAPIARECRYPHTWPAAPWAHGEFVATLAPGETQSLIARGTLEPGVSYSTGESWMSSRHPWLGHLAVSSYNVDLWLDSGAAETELEIRLPASWDASVLAPVRKAEWACCEVWPMTEEGDVRVLRRNFSAEKRPEGVSLRIERSPSWFRRGGPFIGFGASLSGEKGFRTRMGYELALGSEGLRRAMIAGLSVDTDWDKVVIVAPSLSLAMDVVVPSLELGLGLPYIVAPERRVGVRTLTGIHVWGVGFVASYDWFPRSSPSTRSYSQWTLLGELSF